MTNALHRGVYVHLIEELVQQALIGNRKAVARLAVTYVREVAGQHPVVGDEIGYNTLDGFLEQLIDEIKEGQHT